MNLLKALLLTYDRALADGIVDKTGDMKAPNLLPLYHSNKKSKDGKDIYVITLNEKGEFLSGHYLDKDEYIIFPVTESSVNRTRGIAPHPISDEISYLVSDGTSKGNNKETLYKKELEKINDYLSKKKLNNRIFKAIYQYMTRKGTTILEDIANEISGGQLFSVDKNDIVIGGKTKKKSIPMSKVMITFEVDLPESGIISISQNQELHRLYIDYVTEQNQNKSNQEYCDISGNKIYCLGNRSHRGLIGRGKLIGVSNHKDTYIGRFSDWGQIIHIGCETSQKVHNMIKYLIESRNHSINLGEDTFCVSWFLGDLTAGGGHIFDDQKIFDSNDEQLFKTVEDWEKYLDNIGYEHQPHQKSIKSSLGGHLAPELNKYFSGQHKYVENKNENQYCVLILGKINDGRISVKYFQSFAIAEIKENVKRWYTDLAWPHRDERTNTKHLEVPSLKKLIELAYGEETNKSIGCKSTKLLRRNLERLIPYVLNNRMLPRDFFQTAVSRLTNRVSYPNCWEEALYRGCSIIKKYKADRGYVVLDKKGVVRMENSTSFVYGRLLATYEKIEMDTMLLNGGAINRSTNAERLWDVMQNRPLYIATLLQRKIMPYQERLGKKQLWVV